MIGHRSMTALGVALVIVATSLAGQTPAPGPRPPASYPMYLQGQYGNIKRFILGSAEKMPAEHFGFKPVADVRTYGQLLGHIIETNYSYCSNVKGATNPGAGKAFEKIESKPELVQAVKDSFAYCDDTFAKLTNETVVEMITVGSGVNVRQIGRGNQLTMLLIHSNEHYGNLVTYMRIKGIVPPSSEG